MSLEIKQLYEFGEFRLDPLERILMRGDEPVELTPKGFELLKTLVENHGRLLGKDELMDKIWSDSFVEEGNLTFNIRQLRVILDDDAHNPKYIKTVRRHGYRFIADVRQISEQTNARQVLSAPPENQTVETFPAQPLTAAPTKLKKSFSLIFPALAVLLAAVIIFGAWYFKSRSAPPDNSAPAAPFASEKLSTNGKVGLAVISPDGKNVIYTNGAKKQSVWLRQLDSGDNTELIPESTEIYIELAYAPDGNSLYFSRRVPTSLTGGGIYRISVFGGVSQKIIGDVITPLGISPDGSQVAFVRYLTDEKICTIVVADAADGANERPVTTLPIPFYVRDIDFSPDGKRLVFAAGQYKNVTNEVDLMEVDLATGTQHALTNEKFSDITRLAWLPDESCWLITGSKIPVLNYHLWKVPAAGGEAVLFGREAELYDSVSLDKQATRIVATEVRYEHHIRFFSLDDASGKSIQLDGDTADIAPDGTIYFTSWMSGSAEIWSAKPDGSNRRQLTNNKWEEDSPIVSPDNAFIYFSSVQTGKWYFWRMNTDGSNPKQISFTKGGTPLSITSDGEWLYFSEHDDSTLWRISLKTGEEQLILNKKSFYGFTVLPDGSQAAYTEKQGNERVISIVTLADGKTVKTIHLADKKLIPQVVNWTKDGKGLVYVTKNEDTGGAVLWLQALDDASAPRQLAVLTDENIVDFTMPTTPDGKFIAVAQGSTLHDAVLLKGLR